MTTKQNENKQVELQEKVPKLDPRFIITIEGKEFVTYQGLLHLAHQKSIRRIEVEILQFPDKTNDNFAICKAVVESSSGDIFTDIGDANPQNCNSKVAKHLLRMASTRSKARCLRDFTAVGITCIDELDITDGDNGSASCTKSTVKSNNNGNGKDNGNGNGKAKAENQAKGKSTEKPKNVPSMSGAQKRAILSMSRQRKLSTEKLEELVQKTYKVPFQDLSIQEASNLIQFLQSS